MPYFKLANALPMDLAVFKMEKAIRVLCAIDKNVDHLGSLKGGKLDLKLYVQSFIGEIRVFNRQSLNTYKKGF